LSLHGRLTFALLFVGTGFSALAYQVVLSRYIELIVGVTAQAISALLVAFMLGTSIGSAIGGRLADRSAHPLRVYAVAEALIGVYCLSFPLLFPLFSDLYLALAPPPGGDPLARNAVRFATGVAAFLLPSVFMGITTPAFARALAFGKPDSGALLARLYGWNTLGAAAGAFASAYLMVPLLGLSGTMALAAAVNVSVALIAYRLSRPLPRVSEPAGPAPAPPGTTRPHTLLLAAAFTTGLLSFALEVVWTHLLAVILGNSVYAFGLMLGSLLLGLALGTLAARRLAGRPEAARSAIGLALAVAGVAIVLTVGVWDEVPHVFLALSRSSPSFLMMEAVRFVVALALMLVPTALFGISFPLILRLATEQGGGFGASVGRVYAVNTVGAVVGSLCGSYVLLPLAGSLVSLKLLGAYLLLAGSAFFLLLSGFSRRAWVAAAGVALAAWGYYHPVEWNLSSLSMAASIYLGGSPTEGGLTLYQREDATGGLTTVLENRGVLTLLTNGKFQGDDSGEVPIQRRLASIPLLFTPERERALVIGLGTGVTLASVGAHGFKRVVCAEISEPIVEAAALHFGTANENILKSKAVELVYEDGRSVLLERPERYDLVSVEVTTIWFAGVGGIYSQEFYRLASQRLRRNGVLLQWFPMHHLSPRNLYLVVNTVRSVFPYVSIWNHRHQGFIVASNEPLRLDLESIRADAARPAMQRWLQDLPSGSPLELLADLAVTDEEVDSFLDLLARLLRTHRGLVSTDDWPVLEYETPKDLLDEFAYFRNRAVLQRFRSRRPFPFRGTPTESESALAAAAFIRGWADPRALSRLASAWERPELSAAASEWLLEELAGSDLSRGGYETDPIDPMRRAGPGLRQALARAPEETTCAVPDNFVRALRVIPLAVEAASGTSLPPSLPFSAVDGLATADRAWRVRPDGRFPRIDLAFDRPRRLESVHVSAAAIDGRLVRVRILARDTGGHWYPVAGGEDATTLGCPTVRTYRLPPQPAPLTGIRVELRGESLSYRMELREVWAVEH
jgi:spermidine synthase